MHHPAARFDATRDRANRSRTRRSRRGHSLLELIVSSTLVATVVATTVSLMRESLRLSEDSETRNLIATLAVSKLEQHLSLTTNSFQEGTDSGTFAADGYDDMRYTVVRSAQPSDGGVPGKLMVVAITAWSDADGDGAADAGEPVVTLKTKLAWITGWSL